MTGFSNTRLALMIFALAFFAIGVWTGCTVGFDPTQNEKFPCTDDSDCIQGFECASNLCRERRTGSETTCIDDDGDGYGANEADDERLDCPRCEASGNCGRDCNDNDRAINPGAVEQCNNIDDNCNDEVDDPTPCTQNSDCSEIEVPPNGQAECNMTTGSCEVVPTISICQPIDLMPCPCSMAGPAQCTNGMWSDLPGADECFQ